jgi:6-phosphogluconate dehydrogenase
VSEIGMVGLGRMGGNMRERLQAAGITVVGYDSDPARTDVPDLAGLAAALAPPRTVWVMVPAGPVTRAVVSELAEVLDADDLVVDGGNTRYTDDQAHAVELAARGIRYVDCGVSGGIWGKDNGYGLMCGGDPADVAPLLPVFDALRPDGPRAESFVHAGPVGAGHFAKMVHNGIEYGLMQAYAEGYELLAATSLVTDVPGTFQAWQRGTVVRSWLLDLLVLALEQDSGLERLRGYVDDSGEGRWTVQAAVELGVPAPVISAALFARFGSRQDDSPAMRAVAALRQQFGGHAVRQTGVRPDEAGPSSGGGDTRTAAPAGAASHVSDNPSPGADDTRHG